MKTLKWLVIVIACCAPPCLWTACDSSNEQESHEITENCNEFYQALVDEWAICSNGDEQVKENLLEMKQWCKNTVKSTNIPVEIYNECVDVGIGCDMSTGHVVIIEPCLLIVNAE